VTKPTVALTFDDGPSQWTHALLDILDAHHARATFFVLGHHVEGNEPALERAIREGHEIGIHGWDHTPVDLLNPDELRDQINRTRDAILAVHDTPLRWWRAPWEKVNGRAEACAAELGYGYCRATLDGGDVSHGSLWIYDHVLGLLDDRKIVGLHDGIARNGQQIRTDRVATVHAVDRLLKHCRSVTVSELLA